ncbi:MAG: hypothetical protein U0235_28795 [Polyangiaceae bacterium]
MTNASDDDKSVKPDVVLVHGPTEDGKGARVLRVREESIEAGEVRPIEEGKPIAGEVVKLVPRDESGRVCDVEVLVPKAGMAARATPNARPTQKGPAQIASADYRDNWGRIFGKKGEPQLPN